jgi:hypothetical protein
MQLADYIGGEILISIPHFDPKLLLRVKLHGVEAGGIWIESQKFANEFLTHVGASSAPRTAVFFVPYSQVTFAAVSIAGPSLNEKAFGV